MKKDNYYTLAFSDSGTHKMRLREGMYKVDAREIGIKYCKDHNLEYVGTYCKDTIDDAERNLRDEIY